VAGWELSLVTGEVSDGIERRRFSCPLFPPQLWDRFQIALPPIPSTHGDGITHWGQIATPPPTTTGT